MNTAAPKITPMLRQYLEIKEQHPGAIVFYRMGDFYEMFFEDAEIGAKVLGITLTSRSHKDDEQRIPMCGVPHHALEGYLAKMIRAGYKVAICEQMEDPKQAKSLVRREVVRVVTPGATTEEAVLDAKSSCYLAAVVAGRGKHSPWGLSFVDLSTGEFLVCERPDRQGVLDELCRFQPAELLTADEQTPPLDALLEELAPLMPSLCVSRRDPASFAAGESRRLLLDHFRTATLAGFGCEELRQAQRAAGGLLAYLQETQKSDLGHLRRLQPLGSEEYLHLDEITRRNLELCETLVGGRREGSVLSVLDRTSTPMGARLLRKWLLFPLRDPKRIRRRLGAVEDLVEAPSHRQALRELLDRVYDLERLTSRIALGRATARDLLAVKGSLAVLPEIGRVLGQFSAPALVELAADFDPLVDLHELLERAIREDAPPVALREGGLIREGFHQELDELIRLLRDGRSLLLDLEARERERTGIPKLKIGFNKVFGYFLEVGRAHLDKVPEDYVRKQTLAAAERYVTEELKSLEERIATAQDKRLALEYDLFVQVRSQLREHGGRLQETASRLALLDVLAALAECAARHRYRKPQILESSGAIEIREGRHPVIEQSLPAGRFVPNDVLLDNETQQLLVITGPNMAGKSTVLRQTALIVLLAHMGSFVPAASARIGIVDRIFTRVGASDALTRGQSTFLVEMNETAEILHHATEQSLIILDEIGRGTSTFDGISIAWAVAEAICRDLKARTLFATHYHELTELALVMDGVRNLNVAVKEWGDEIIFLRKIQEGPADKSYGIQVARLAGLPEAVVARAREVLENLENAELNEVGRPKLAHRKDAEPLVAPQLDLFTTQPDPVVRELLGLDIARMTPIEALNKLYEFQRKAEGGATPGEGAG